MIIDDLNKYNGVIQALTAILNFFVIGFLTYRANKLQKLSYLNTQYAIYQQEVYDCLNTLDESVQYFHSQELSTSKYLYDLELSCDDTSNKDLSNQVLKNLRNILYRLEVLKVTLRDNLLSINSYGLNEKQLSYNISVLKGFRSYLFDDNPMKKYDFLINGAESVWLDAEINITNAFDETMKTLNDLYEEVKYLR